jgi:YfiH family protein
VTQVLRRAQVGPAQVWCSGTAIGNVGDHVGDDPDAVASHRDALARATELRPPTEWVWLRQVHGNTVHIATGPTPTAEPPEADAAVTATPGLPIAIVTADCAPVVLASDDAVSVVHAGHRGLASGVIEAAVAELRAIGDAPIAAFLGPCIHVSSYEFGVNDLERLTEQFGPEVVGTTAAGRPAFDIPRAIGIVLERIGVAPFADCDVDTYVDPGSFSFRRDPNTGRQATVAVLA